MTDSKEFNVRKHSPESPESPESSRLLTSSALSRPSLFRTGLLILIVPFLLLLVSTVAIVIMVSMAAGDRSVINQGLSNWFPYIAMVNHTLLLLIVVWFARLDGLSLTSLGWKQTIAGWPLALLIGALAGIAIYLVQTYASEPAVGALRDALHLGSLRPASTPTLHFNLAGLIAGTLFAGVVEETVFRGYMQRQLTARFGNWIGILLATLVFSVGLHWGFGPWGLIVVFVNGLLLALLFHWRQNLLTCATAHAVVNALVLTL